MSRFFYNQTIIILIKEMINIVGSFIQYAAGYDKDNVTELDIIKALNDLPTMDDEHGAFFVGVYGENTEEFVLELHKDLTLFAIFEEENYKIRLTKIEEASIYFKLLLAGDTNKITEWLKIKN